MNFLKFSPKFVQISHESKYFKPPKSFIPKTILKKVYIEISQKNPWETLKRSYTMPSGTPGSGVGKGGGGGGSVRESGGGLGQYGAAQEEGYFYGKQKEQLEKIKQKLKDKALEISQKEDK